VGDSPTHFTNISRLGLPREKTVGGPRRRHPGIPGPALKISFSGYVHGGEDQLWENWGHISN